MIRFAWKPSIALQAIAKQSAERGICCRDSAPGHLLPAGDCMQSLRGIEIL
ncbi:MAG: hypothetical protein ACI9ND_001672, partial [Yoonia sp.]